jgi:hypothetical protein
VARASCNDITVIQLDLTLPQGSISSPGTVALTPIGT